MLGYKGLLRQWKVSLFSRCGLLLCLAGRAVTRGVVLTISITTRTTQGGEREGGPGISNTRRQTRDMSRDGDDDDVHVTLHVTLPTSRHMSPVTHKPCYPSPDKDLNLSSPLAFRSQIKYLRWR